MIELKDIEVAALSNYAMTVSIRYYDRYQKMSVWLMDIAVHRDSTVLVFTYGGPVSGLKPNPFADGDMSLQLHKFLGKASTIVKPEAIHDLVLWLTDKWLARYGDTVKAAARTKAAIDAARPTVPKFPEDKDRRVIEPPSGVPVFSTENDDRIIQLISTNGGDDRDIKVAVLKLDPKIDQHWVMTGCNKGKPKLQAVEDAYGKAGLTRQDVERAMPQYTREAAATVKVKTVDMSHFRS